MDDPASGLGLRPPGDQSIHIGCFQQGPMCGPVSEFSRISKDGMGHCGIERATNWFSTAVCRTVLIIVVLSWHASACGANASDADQLVFVSSPSTAALCQVASHTYIAIWTPVRRYQLIRCQAANSHHYPWRFQTLEQRPRGAWIGGAIIETFCRRDNKPDKAMR